MTFESGTLLKNRVVMLKYYITDSLRQFTKTYEDLLFWGKQKFGNLHAYLIYAIELIKAVLRYFYLLENILVNGHYLEKIN